MIRLFLILSLQIFDCLGFVVRIIRELQYGLKLYHKLEMVLGAQLTVVVTCSRQTMIGDKSVINENLHRMTYRQPYSNMKPEKLKN
mgnify:CR=1 FL=1